VKTLKTALWLALAVLLAAPLSAATIYLKDGTQVRGTVVSATANYVTVHTQDGATRRITSDKIARIDYAETPAPPPPSPAAAPPAPSEWRRLQQTGFESTKQQVDIGLGFAAPLGSIDFGSIGGGQGSNGDIGILVDGRYLYYRTPQLAFGAGIDFLHRSATDSTSLIQSADTNVWGNTVLLQALARYLFVDHGTTRPYIQAGLGPEHTSTFIDATPSPGFAWSDTNTAESRRLVDEGHWGLGGSVAVGLDFEFTAPSVFSLELGWTGVSSAKYAATPAGQALGLTDVSGGVSYITVAARWGWRF